MRLVDFEIELVARGVHSVGLWEKGQGTSLFTKSLPVVEFNKLHAQNKKNGLRLADFEFIRKRSTLHVISLWNVGQLDEHFSPAMKASGLKERNAYFRKKDMYPVDIERIVKGRKSICYRSMGKWQWAKRGD